LEQLVCKPGDIPALRSLYARWGFKSLLRELDPPSPLDRELFPETAEAR